MSARGGAGPWPWILGGLLLFMVTSSLAFLRVALSHPDPLVVEDGYTAGRDYNERVRAARRGEALGWQLSLAADLQGSEAGVQVAVRDAGGRPVAVDRVVLSRVRPAEGGLDAELDLAPAGFGDFAGRVALPRAGRWHLRVRAERGDDAVERTFAVWAP